MSCRRVRLVGVIILCLPLGACGQAMDWLKKIAKLDNDDLVYQAPPGEEASPFLAKTIRDADGDIATALAALSVGIDQADNAEGTGLGLLADDGSVAQGDAASLQYLLATQAAKDSFKEEGFVRDPADEVARAPDALGLGPELDAMTLAEQTVNWTHAANEFTVSPLAKMPVRNQGARGTCASFTGIGQIEGFIIKHYGVAGIDLSEQRFYYLSKPENWGDGGDKAKGGSNAGTGFAKSAGYNYNKTPYDRDAPDTPKDYNIPLETDCPYGNKLGGNDLQTPQTGGCLNNGVARVKDYTAWLYNWEQQLNTPQEIYDFLIARDYPVTVATKLSANWEKNDGLITLKGAGVPGDSSHASGHAYLVVGARKLDESKYPGEGGMCFIIRNSWGNGWGVNGMSCMTLAWFNQWRFPNAFPQVLDVDLNTAKVEGARRALDERPSNLNGPGAKKGDAPKQTGRKKRGTVSFFTVTGQGLNLANDDMSYGTLRTSTGDFARMFYLINENTMTIRAILKEKNGDADVSQDLVLIYQPPQVLASFDNDLPVGSFDPEAKTLQLCTGDYAKTCVLHYYAETNELIVGLTKTRFYQEDAKGPFDWTSFTLGGYGIDLSKAEGSNSRMDVRFVTAGEKTNPLRFKIDPFGGDVRYAGQTIGNYQKMSFCSGENQYRDVCRIVIGGGDFGVLFKAKK